MGALHDGHLSLVKRCAGENDICVVSIFVNPSQFNEKKDFETYPRTPDKDCKMLLPAGCRYVFAPAEKEMASAPGHAFDLGRVAEVMEGAYRPGHFDGVAQIVGKLFDIVEPDKAYFGEKDFQQIAVIKVMTKQLNRSVQIVSCSVVREPDGLAMSSRNVRLTPMQRQKAPLIAKTLKESLAFAPGRSVGDAVAYVVDTINHDPVFRVEYFEIVDGNTLGTIHDWAETAAPVGCIAVYCGEVRLIDNIKYPLAN
ncbi:MAG: pantothenate synthetase [Bacteroidales bacterium]